MKGGHASAAPQVVARLLVVRAWRRHSERLLEPKLQKCFARDANLLPVRHHLDSRAGPGADTRADRCTLASARDGANDRTNGCATTNSLRALLSARLAGDVVVG